MAANHPILSRRDALGQLALLGAGSLASCAAASVPKVRTQFGINSVRIFLNSLDAGGNVGPAVLATLGKRGIPFVRFAASAQWAGDWKRYEADTKRYWAIMDTLFRAAEHEGVQLVPSVLWHTVALAFHCREPMQAWANPASRTRKFARSYTRQFVERYDRSPALLMYEFANELNTWVDIPDIHKFWPKRDPTLPDRLRVEQDKLTSVQLREFTGDFGKTIRARSKRPIGMGSDIPRPNAWHLARGTWDLDTPEQFIAQFRAITPPELTVLSMHLYEEKYGGKNHVFASLPPLLKAFAEAAALDKRIAFLGEFGVPRLADRKEEQRRFDAMIQALIGSNIHYAAAWNYSPHVFQREWDIAANNDRAYQFEALAEANK